MIKINELGFRNLELMLLPRWGEFMLCATLPRAVPTADEFCPFRGQVGALGKGRLGMCKIWVVRVLILHLYFVSVLSTFVINFFTSWSASPTSVTSIDEIGVSYRIAIRQGSR